eukprot:222574_1
MKMFLPSIYHLLINEKKHINIISHTPTDPHTQQLIECPSFNRKMGSRISGIDFCNNHNVKRVHRYENKTYLNKCVNLWTTASDIMWKKFIKYAISYSINKKFP